MNSTPWQALEIQPNMVARFLDQAHPDGLQEVAGLRLLDLDVLVGEHVERVVEEPHGDLLGLNEMAAPDERERGLRKVEPSHEEGRWRGQRPGASPTLRRMS